MQAVDAHSARCLRNKFPSLRRRLADVTESKAHAEIRIVLYVLPKFGPLLSRELESDFLGLLYLFLCSRNSAFSFRFVVCMTPEGCG